MVPLGVHGDGVAYMGVNRAGGKSLEVLSWSSLLTQGPTRSSTFLLFLLVKSVAKDSGFSQTWPRAWKALCWSFQALATGKWPMLDWDNNEFDKATIDYQLRGSDLADGLCGVIFVLRADLDFLSNHFHLNNPGSNNPCALCQASRSLDSCPWTDCNAQAGWRDTVWKSSEWLAEHPTCHPFFRMSGSGLDLVFPDLMHTKHLGTDQFLLGSVLVWLIKHFLGGTKQQNLNEVWNFIQTWYKDCSLMTVLGSLEIHSLYLVVWKSTVFEDSADLSTKSPRKDVAWNLEAWVMDALEENPSKKKRLANLKETMLKGSPFPKLHAKAAETKALIQPVSLALQHFRDQRPGDKDLVDLMVTALECSHSIDVLVDDLQSFSVPPAAGRELERLVNRMNVGITKLCLHFHSSGIFLFNFVPKNHYLIHLAQLGKHMSPKLAWCYQGEDLMRKVKVMAVGSFNATPPRMLGNKILDKYLVGLSHVLSQS